MYYFHVRGRLLDCPPNINSINGYSLIVYENRIDLMKSQCTEPFGDQLLTSVERELPVEMWHTLHFIMIGNHIQVLLDGQEYLDYYDEETPLLDGGDMWFDVRDGNEIVLDNLLVYEIIPSEGEDIVLPD